MNDERQGGQSIILVAIMALALVALAAMAVDLSNAYFFRRTAQNAADAAALAAAEELAWQRNHPSEMKSGSAALIKAAANDLAERNGIEDTDPNEAWINNNVETYYLQGNTQPLPDPFPTKKNDKTWEFAFGVKAVTYITAPTFLGGVLGWDGYPVSAEAAVSLNANPCGVTCVKPIATYVFTDDDSGNGRFETGEDPPWAVWATSGHTETLPFECYNIWNGEDSGNFGWLNWSNQDLPCADPTKNPGSEECLASDLDPDYCVGYISVGDEVNGTTGVKTSVNVEWELSRYIGRPEMIDDPYWYPKSFIVPVFTTTIDVGGSNAMYIVAGFAEFQLIGYDLSYNNADPNPNSFPLPTYDPWVSPTLCTNVFQNGVTEPLTIPVEYTRLTAYFKNFVDPSALVGDCNSEGTVTTIRLWE
jgi:Flp pilus assembly protein TadG